MASTTAPTETSQPGDIVDVLRGLIIRGTLAPGEHLGQAELAQRFKISKVPIRESLKQLATEGLLWHDQNRGYFVAGLSLGEAQQLYRLRRWIESELLDTARWPTEEELEAFRRGFDQVDKLNRKGEYAGWAAALEDVRRSIFELSHERVLLREAVRLWSLTDRYRAVLPRNTSDSGERALVDALERHDRSALLRAYHSNRDQIESILADVLENADIGLDAEE